MYRRYIESGVTIGDLEQRLTELNSENSSKRKKFAQLDSRLKSEQENIDSLTQYLQKRLDGLEKDCEERRAIQKSLQNNIEEINEKALQEMGQLDNEIYPIVNQRKDELGGKKTNYNLRE